MHSVSFPGLGIAPIAVNSVAFSIGSLTVNWYGLFITFGMILAVLYVGFRTRQRGIPFDHILDLALFVIVFGVIGARLFYVLTSLDNPYYQNVLNWFKIWEGGLGIYGGIIGGAIAMIVVLRIKKISFPLVADCTCSALLIGQIIGRWGNFCNCEAHGGETALPWGMSIDGGVPVHPTFLYESLWNLIGFMLINLFYRKKKYDGELTIFMFAWYGFGRMFIELLRTDSLYLFPITDAEGNHPWFLKISVLLGFFFFVAGTVLLILHRVKKTDFWFKPIPTSAGLPADAIHDDKFTRVATRAFVIGIPAFEAALILGIVFGSVFQNL